MNYATNFAVVKDGVVENIIWGLVYNMDEFPGVVQIDDKPVQIGDTYAGGVFYRNGAPVESSVDEAADMQAALELLGVNANG